MFAFKNPFEELFSSPSESNSNDGFPDFLFSLMNESENKRRKRSYEKQKDEDNSRNKKNKKNDVFENVFADLCRKLSVDYGQVTIKAKEDSYEFIVDLPGLKKEDIQLSFEEDNLVIEGERKEDMEEEETEKAEKEETEETEKEETEETKETKKKEVIVLNERHVGEFRRRIPLPRNINKESVSAKYTDGVLKVELGKKESDKQLICIN